MESYRNTALTHTAAFLKLKICNISCGTFTGEWACTLPFNRLIYIFQGSQTPSRIYNDVSEFKMESGNWLFIPAGICSNHEQNEGLFLISIQFNLELISGAEYMYGCSGMYMGNSPEQRDEFFSLMNKDPEIPDIFILQKLIWNFLSPIVAKEKENLFSRTDRFLRFQSLFDEFTKEPYKDFSVQEMAKLMKMGKESFIKHFTAETGCSPKLFFHRLRAAAAARELLSNHGTIREIAEKFHFYDEFYFSRFMKKMTGLSPREYRTKMSFQLISEKNQTR